MATGQNRPPVADAGSDQLITTSAATTAAFLDGGASRDPDGQLLAFEWRRVSGSGSATIVTPGLTQSVVTGLVAGSHVFCLRVSDGSGRVAEDTTTLVVQRTPNHAPVADAGPDQLIAITAASTTVVLDGSRSYDPEGALVAWRWQQTAGAPCTIVSPTVAQTLVAGITPGQRAFQLTVTDSSGALAADSMVVRVERLANTGPVADAGADREIELAIGVSLATVVLDGSASSDADGTIVTFAWSRLAGPGTPTMVTPSLAQTVVAGLALGSHEFALRVTDDRGAIAEDRVVVRVVRKQRQGPIARARRDTVLVLPLNAATLDGSTSSAAAGASLVNYFWEQVGGPAEGCARGHATPQLALTGLMPGSYRYRLSITDDSGAMASDDVVITVRRKPA